MSCSQEASTTRFEAIYLGENPCLQGDQVKVTSHVPEMLRLIKQDSISQTSFVVVTITNLPNPVKVANQGFSFQVKSTQQQTWCQRVIPSVYETLQVEAVAR